MARADAEILVAQSSYEGWAAALAKPIGMMSAHARGFARARFSTERYVAGYRQVFEMARDLVAAESASR